MNPRIIFFGTPDYSLIILEALHKAKFPIVAVVTKPPRPIGRKQILTETPVARWAANHQVVSITPQTHALHYWQYADEAKFMSEVLTTKPDILITADYTQLIPMPLIRQVKYGGLNIHPSLLPHYRGPAPVPWAILNGETETGVSIVTLAEKFDEGVVIAQEKEPIKNDDTTHTLLTRLFEKGAELLVDILPQYIKKNPNYQLPTTNSLPSSTPRLTREHGFIPWELIQSAIEGKIFDLATMKQCSNETIFKTLTASSRNALQNTSIAIFLDRLFRAFHPWPGLWTKIRINNQEKRMKLLDVKLKENKLIINSVQLEGKTPFHGSETEKMIQKILAT
ncbi:methionyl-tRNA formyltransferase [Candidatus Microgenomates bacterium]|nr:MAG: methionyl-tRNA formyltransferase [Candidatus Microgenomates bacterium]